MQVGAGQFYVGVRQEDYMSDSLRDRMQETGPNKDRCDSRKPMIHDADSLRVRMREIIAYKRRHTRADSCEANPCQTDSYEVDSLRGRLIP